MGGVVGLKGTDGAIILREAIKKGAGPVSPKRGKEFLSILSEKQGISLFVAEGRMGADIARELGLEFVPINSVGSETTRMDTVRIARSMLKQGIDVLVFVGGDGTARDVLEAVGASVTVLGVPKKTLLGVDVVRGDGTILGLDVSETQILPLVKDSKARIIVSPIGGQGFFLGRGNQQISPKVIRKVGVDDLVIVATKNKIGMLWPRRLLVDSGDPDLDESLRGYRRIIIGYREEMMIKIE